ncbi:FtsX-like permease family protein [Rubripirellula lacrimiformis]|uniref:FtsX-like permease family protein n=1 Tax=Rubripirellula lacrimiformis TaxID=1930273 RepID=A0A517NGJ4_9BACT|nr:ABC transporter permease [Rubripirellula lacrimiformis]QDT06255.1 FtsX-like permease family protein [Rubripirellula lacrimiformis]
MLRNLAIRTLLHDRGKLAAALVGVVFSVVLVNVQGGLFLGLIGKASVLVDRSDADIWVGHRGMCNVDFPHNIPHRWEQRIRSLPGVDRVASLRIGYSEMSLPGGSYEGVVVVGVPSKGEFQTPFQIVQGSAEALDYPDGIVVDQCEDQKLGSPNVNELREIGDQRVRITGKSWGILNFLVTPYVFTTHQRAASLAGMPPDQTSYFLVGARPGTDLANLCAAIEQRLPETTALTADDFAAVSVDFWMTRTGLGISFGAATLLGLFIGLVMVGQTLYAMVLDRISEFATLKAIGATEWEVLHVLLMQTSVVAVMGIASGTMVSYFLQLLLSSPRAEINIPLQLYFASATMVFLICLVASGIPYLRVRRVDPHSILQG